MLPAMIRTLLLASSLTLLLGATAASAREPARDAARAPSLLTQRPGAPLAKAPKKGKKGAEKPPEKPAAVPEGARSDPRASAATSAPPAEATAGAGLGGRGMSRIEFDDRLVQGQTNKANAIYLFERRESSLRSLLKKRSDFHEEIDETLE